MGNTFYALVENRYHRFNLLGIYQYFEEAKEISKKILENERNPDYRIDIMKCITNTVSNKPSIVSTMYWDYRVDEIVESKYS